MTSKETSGTETKNKRLQRVSEVTEHSFTHLWVY